MPKCYLIMPKRTAWFGVAQYLLTPEDTSAGARQSPPALIPPYDGKGACRCKALFWTVMAVVLGLGVAQLV